MKLPEHVRIAGMRTVGEWFALRPSLLDGNDNEAWKRAFVVFFEGRLKSRYFGPIEAIQKINCNVGEGFSIVALQCSLIEFLHATRKGLKYVYGNSDPRKFEYSHSKDIFVDFLSSVAPFDEVFSCKNKHRKFNCRCKAKVFYESVRCGLLHEARTKGIWTISVKSGPGPCVDFTTSIVYRDRLQKMLEDYIAMYGEELRASKGLQEAFIRKFDDLCSE